MKGPPDATTTNRDAAPEAPYEEPFRLRSYQAEMVLESMASNIICVMDTGSGKTHIAIDRTRAELETCQPEKLVWFLAPTVTLCEQQYEVFKSNLPSYSIQLLSGKDNVDHWTEQAVWDTVLLNVRIVLSTHQVLLDALTHAFVKMRRLALLIFDEAHHCTENHPAHKIMSDFYMPRVGNAHEQLPAILGLSASPVMKAKATSEDLQQIEKNMCCTARTPKMHRSELMRYIHRPQLIRLDYPVEDASQIETKSFVSLHCIYANYDLKNDPYMLKLLKQQRNGEDVSKQLHKLFTGGKTYCRDQLRSLFLKAKATLEELGSSPMEWYLAQCIAQFKRLAHASDSQLLDWTVDEKKHLLDILTGPSLTDLRVHESQPISLDRTSRKIRLLVDLLTTEAKDNPEFTCLVFVEQRIWLACIAEILALHPQAQALLRVGTFVGTSQNNKRKANVASFAEPRNYEATLDNFRAGNLNVILATSVLEEGIDIPSCHLVICFERPKNLKSFVQMRGRARKQASKYVIFMPEVRGGRPPESWQSLEEEMKREYLDDERQVKEAEKRKLENEDGQRYFEVPSTGALLTLDNASQHLHHFCALLGSGPYVDARPQFDFTETPLSGISARVMLPISIDPAVRTANSLETWKTERFAKQDAAFEAYINLYRAGLVNDNLLPAPQEADEELSELQIPDHRPALVDVSTTFDPWPLIAQLQHKDPHVYYRTILALRVSGSDGTPIYMLLLTPNPLPNISEIPIYWNESRVFKVKSTWLSSTELSEDEVTALKSVTYKILVSVFNGRMETNRHDFPWLLAPCDATGHVDVNVCLSGWAQNPVRATDLITRNRSTVEWGLLTRTGDSRVFLPRALTVDNRVQAIRLPKRRDFLHPVLSTAANNDAYTRVEEIPASECVVGGVPFTYSIFALLFPSILHRFDVGIVADTLRTTVLLPLALDSTTLPLITQAITSSATDEADNYQRLEFLGDCILKFFASIHLMAARLGWPESYLTAKKGKIVSNGFLARATLAAGLDKFVITKRFTGAKWSPRYAADLLATTEPTPKIQRSSKLIADIVESLIGASYTIGGLDKAYLCLQTLLPLEPWTSINAANAILYDAALAEHGTLNLGSLELLLGHTFTRKSLLLEALTHASFQGPNAHSSYERLEFLGDAVLDYIISRRLYAHEPALSHQSMHAIRTATVNASFLAFRMFETTVPETTTNKTTMLPELQYRALWQFLRTGDTILNAHRDVALKQHQVAREQVIASLKCDARYPWHLFALTDPPKFLSDIVESVIGAVYIDSRGDIPSCERVVHRLGILDNLERILRDGVDCLHPKERLGHLAGDKNVHYVPFNEEEAMADHGGMRHRCQVKVGGENVGGVEKGLKRLNAEIIAAWRAVGILEKGGDVVMMDQSEEEGEFFDAEGDDD